MMATGARGELFFERLAIGELPARERRGWDRLRRADAATERLTQERLGRIREDNRAFLAVHPAEEVVAEIERRAARARAALLSPRIATPRQRASRTLVLLGAPALAFALLAAAVFPFVLPRLQRGDPVRYKGGSPTLLCYRRGAEGIERLAPDSVVAAGDEIQLAYSAASRRYGAILSVDGRGAVTLHFPASRGESTKLDEAGATFLPYSFVVDDAPLFERFSFFVSDRAIDLDAVYAYLEKGAPLPAGVSEGSLVLRKENK